MTKDVIISITGLQAVAEEGLLEPVEVVTVGEYYFRNGHHFVKYEEVVEDVPGTTINYIKADGKSVEVIKKGAVDVDMVFEEQKKNVTYYNTPFGSIQMGIAATDVKVEESPDNLAMKVEYALDVNEEHIADCTILIHVQSKNSKTFALS